jgi:limonene-1,2-epoxide hydrolase
VPIDGSYGAPAGVRSVWFAPKPDNGQLLEYNALANTRAPSEGVDMGSREERVARSFLDCLVARDIEGALDHYAEDAQYHVGAWMPPLEGDAARDGVRREFDTTGYHYSILNIASTDTVVFLEVIDGQTRDGKQFTMHWCGVWEINASGKITSRRDYWDAKEYESQVT